VSLAITISLFLNILKEYPHKGNFVRENTRIICYVVSNSTIHYYRESDTLESVSRIDKAMSIVYAVKN